MCKLAGGLGKAAPANPHNSSLGAACTQQ